MKNGRLVVFDILQSILRDGAYSNIALEKGIKEAPLKDKGFVSCLVYGVVERQLTLDYVINQFLDGRTKPKVKIILYIGAYQLLFMDKVPAPAAINESVNLADEVGVGFYKKLINAVLHKVFDYKYKLNEIDDLSIQYSCPEHLINMWKKMYGENETIEILSAINNRPPIFAVPNRKFVDEEELQYELMDAGINCEIFNDVVRINSSIDFESCKAFKDGLFYIEDYSSYTAAKALCVKENDLVLDICAAPGGKSFTIAQHLGQDVKLYSFDLYEHKINLINNSAKRLGLDSVISAAINDGTVYNAEMPKADKILCDVVCSGFGIIRRKPEIRYKDLDSIKTLPEIQYNILQTSSRYLKNGGSIMYSTCTLNKRENEKVVEKFLQNNHDFKLVKMVTTFPSVDGGDGFFYALMKKND